MSIRRRIRETGSSGITSSRDNFLEEEVAGEGEEVEDVEENNEEEPAKKESESENNEEITEQEASSPKPAVNKTKSSGKSSKRSQYQANNYRQRTYQSRGYRPSNLEVETASHPQKFRLKRYKRYSQSNSNSNNQYTNYNNQDDYTYNQDANRNPDDEGTDSDFDQGTVDQIEEPRPIRTKHVPELMMTISAPVFDTKNYTVSLFLPSGNFACH